MTFHRIISGGQTGADRAALDAALELCFPCGGWCPSDRRADDGALSSRYPLTELPSGGYRQRTIRNVTDSDGTVLFYFVSPTGGTRLTLTTCTRLNKPHLLLDASAVPHAQAAAHIAHFIQVQSIGALNVAGPSERRNAGTYAYVHAVMRSLLEAVGAGA